MASSNLVAAFEKLNSLLSQQQTTWYYLPQPQVDAYYNRAWAEWEAVYAEVFYAAEDAGLLPFVQLELAELHQLRMNYCDVARTLRSGKGGRTSARLGKDKSLNQLARQAGELSSRLSSYLKRPVAEKSESVESERHSQDFRTVQWHGRTFKFSPNQAAIVKLLWEDWEEGAAGVGGAALLEAADSNQQKVFSVFRGNEAWGTLIVSPQRGIYKLNTLEQSDRRQKNAPIMHP